MSDPTTNAGTATEGNKPVPFDIEKVNPEAFIMPDEAAKFVELYGKLSEHVPSMLRLNFDPDQPFPADCDAMILPLSKQVKQPDGENKNVTAVVVVATIPSFAALSAHPKGMDFVREAVTRMFANKLGSAFRPRPDGTKAASVPRTIEDFIENRREVTAEAWKKIGPILVAALRKKGLVTITQAILRKCLASTPFAKATYTNIPQDQWLGILEVGKQLAAKLSQDASLFTTWAEQRDQQTAEAVEVTDLSLDLDKLIEKPAPTA